MGVQIMKVPSKVLLSLLALCGLITAFKTLNKSQFTLIAIGAFPTAIGAHFIAGEKVAKKERELKSKTDSVIKELHDIETLQYNAEKNLNKAIAEIRQLTDEKQRLNDLVVLTAKNAVEAENAINFLSETNTKNEILIKETREYIAELEAEISEWENTFNQKVETRAREIVTTQMNKVFAENDVITSKAMDCSRKFYQIILKAQSRLDSMKCAANSFIEETNTKAETTKLFIEQEITEYLQQIELLNEKVARLQRENSGDLLEPEYFQANYDINAQIANSIAKEFYQLTQISLSVKGFQVNSTGVVDIGFGYSRSANHQAIVETLKQCSAQIAKSLGLYKVTAIKKLEIGDLIQLSFRREAVINEKTAKDYAGTPEEFIQYIVSHPIRYRLIANPGMGKSPTLAVMISEILKAGCHKGNKARSAKVENTLVTVSYPDAESSLKDSDYPLDIFLKYGNTTLANKSFGDAIDDWEFRKQFVNYAAKFFKLWVWEELDNTLDSASDAQDSSSKLKKVLKQGGHSNIGFIVSGQSVMTKQIKGFTNDDRKLFTEIIIGIDKIRTYINVYGKNNSNLKRLLDNLDDLEQFIESKNSKITDEAREYRIALVMDERSPKLYFLPNLDCVNFDAKQIENTRREAEIYREVLINQASTGMNLESIDSQVITERQSSQSNMAMVATMSVVKPLCPHCGSDDIKKHSDKRYACRKCKKRVIETKVVWK